MCGQFSNGGIEEYLLHILDRINMDNYEIHVVLAGNYFHAKEQELLNRNIRVIHYNGANRIHEQLRDIHQILRDGKYHIVHIMHSYVAIEAPVVFSIACLLVKKQLGFKTIHHSHGTEDTTRTISHPKRALRSLFRSVIRFLLRRADILAACSPEAGAFLYGAKADVQVLYNGIDLERFHDAAASAEIALWREQYHIPENRTNFVAVARISDQKNPLFLVRIIECLRKIYPDILLTWVGDGVMFDDVNRLIEDLQLRENIKLLGFQPHVEQILPCCDYFILPSKREGAPLVLIEAQAAGLTCFASDRVPDIVDCGGITFIGLEKPAAAWAEKIHKTIRLSPKGDVQTDWLKRFDVNETITVLSRLYDNLAGDE